MDNSANKIQQNTGDQSVPPIVQPNSAQSDVQNAPAQTVEEVHATKVVPNRGGIPVESVTKPLLQNKTDEVQSLPPSQIPEEKPQKTTAAEQPESSPRSKEHEPALHTKSEVDKMTEAEIVTEEKEVEKELESLVEKSSDTEKPNIPKDVQQAGVTHAGEDVPVHPTTSGFVTLPMSYDEAEFTRKKYKWKNSVSWFAALIMYHWKKIKITTKEVKNKEE